MRFLISVFVAAIRPDLARGPFVTLSNTEWDIPET